jgi:hypothetical protein
MSLAVDIAHGVYVERVREDAFQDFAYAVYFAAGEGVDEGEDFGARVGQDELVVWFVFVGADFGEQGVCLY